MPTLENHADLKKMEQDLLNNYAIGNGFGGSGLKNTTRQLNIPQGDFGKFGLLSAITEPENTLKKRVKLPTDTAIRMDDFSPHGEEVTMWSGLKLSTTGGLASLVQQFMSEKKTNRSKNAILNTLNSSKAHLNKIGSNGNRINMLDLMNSPAIQNVLNDPETEKQRIANNEELISSNFPFIGQLTPDKLDKQKIMVVNGQTFIGKEATQMERLGLSLTNTWKDIPDSIQVQMSWGEAFKRAVMSPEVVGATLNLFGESPRINDMLAVASSGIEILPIAKEVMNPEFDKYAAALKIAYASLSDEDKQIVALYKYYKTNMINYNDPIMNPNGDQWNLGREISDSFFGSINYNVTNFIKGGSDYVAETWQNVSLEGAEFVRDTFDEFNGFTKSFEDATGIKLQLDPKFEKGVYDTMEKLGFGQPGIGTDTQAYIQNALITKTTCKINDEIFVDFNNVLSYHEIFDFRRSRFAKRRMLIRLTNAQLAMLKLDAKEGENKITVNRKYGFALGQHPKGTLPYNYNTEFTEYDEIKDFHFKVTKDDVTGDRAHLQTLLKFTPDKKSIFDQGKTKADPNLTYQDIWIELYPPNLLQADNGVPINGIPNGVPVSTLILQGFQTSIDENFKIVMEPPKNDVVLKDVAIPPQTFTQLVENLQKDYGIYPGGVNIFIDRDLFYVLPKEGLTEFEVDKEHIDGSWEFEFRIRKPETEPHPEMLVFLIPSRRKIIWPLTEADISSPTDSGEFKVVSNPYSKGSITGTTQGVTGNRLDSHITAHQHSYMTPKPVENKQYYNLFLKIPHTFARFTPGDKITVRWRGVKYVGDVRKWASQQHKNERRVILDLICEIDPEKKDFLDKVSPGNWIEQMQQKVAEVNLKIENKLVEYSDKTGDWIQNQLNHFHKNVESPRIYEALKIIEEDFEVPDLTIDYMSNYAGTGALDELEEYGMGTRYIQGVGVIPDGVNNLFNNPLFEKKVEESEGWKNSIWSLVPEKKEAQPPTKTTKKTKSSKKK